MSDIPPGDGKIDNLFYSVYCSTCFLFLRCLINFYKYSTVRWQIQTCLWCKCFAFAILFPVKILSRNLLLFFLSAYIQNSKTIFIVMFYSTKALNSVRSYSTRYSIMMPSWLQFLTSVCTKNMFRSLAWTWSQSSLRHAVSYIVLNIRLCHHMVRVMMSYDH